MKSVVKGKKRLEACALLLDPLGEFMGLGGKEAAPQPEKKKVHWLEPLVSKAKNRRITPLGMLIPALASLSDVNGRGLVATTKG